jgi:hypothetical protein
LQKLLKKLQLLLLPLPLLKLPQLLKLKKLELNKIVKNGKLNLKLKWKRELELLKKTKPK